MRRIYNMHRSALQDLFLKCSFFRYLTVSGDILLYACIIHITRAIMELIITRTYIYIKCHVYPN